MMPWVVALGYADWVHEKCIKVDIPEGAKLSWMRARDEQTRADMAQLVCEEWPAGEALEKAKEQQAHYWRMKDDLVAVPPPPELRPDQVRPPKRQFESDAWQGGDRAKGGGKKQRGENKIIQRELSRISRDAKGVKYCGAWNSPKGRVKDERRCPQGGKHMCSIQLQKGKACGMRSHNAINH